MLRLIAALFLSWAQTAAAAEVHFVVISGIGGEQEYSRLFRTWSLDILSAAHQELGIPPSRTLYLADLGQTESARTDGNSRKESIIEALSRVGGRAGENDTVAVFLIGHGSVQNGMGYFNIPGPDISATELAEALDTINAGTLLVVNTTPSSGTFLPALSGPNRIVITATRDGTENNHTLFADHLATGLASGAADADKNERVSVLEAFDYARREVEREYRSDRRLLTEHAMLDDDGNGIGSLEPGSGEGDGDLARITYLEAESRIVRASDTVRRELTRLRARSDDIEERIESLQAEKERMVPAEYDDRLEELLVELALNRRARQAAEAGK